MVRPHTRVLIREKTPKKQVHFLLDEADYEQYKVALKKRRYSSAAEHFHEKVREVIQEAEKLESP